MSSAMHTKKRKRADSAGDTLNINLSQESAEPGTVGPALGTFIYPQFQSQRR